MTDLLDTTIVAIPDVSEEARAAAWARIDTLTMPPRALGRLLDLGADLSAMTGAVPPVVSNKTVVVCAGDHGVAAKGVSAFPQEVTAQMVANFVAGGAGINVLAKGSGANVVVADFGVATPLPPGCAESVRDLKVAPGTVDLSTGPAMTREQAHTCLERGIALGQELAETNNVLATGEMGIGNTTPASCIISALTGLAAELTVGRGTGIANEARQQKVAIVEEAVQRIEGRDPMLILQQVGGFEIGGLAGLILGAASKQTPIVVDGFISTAAACLAKALAPKSANYLVSSHKSVEPGHVAMLEYLNLDPYLDLGLRLGEGTGAALCFHLVDAAAAILTDMATFADAGVAES